MRQNWRLAPVAIALAGVVGLGGTAMADVAGFYKGKSMRIVVGSSAGGGFDAFGRMVGRNMGAYIPGNPKFVVSNLPGAGSLKAVQSIRAQAADGTYMVLFNPGQVIASLVFPEKVKLKFTEFAFLGSATADARVCWAWHTTGVKTMADLLKRKQFSTGHTSKRAATYIDAAIIKNLFGAKLKQIVGYPGSSEQRLAVERGELDGDCGSWDSVPANWVRDNKVNVFVRISKATAPELPPVPHISDFANDEQKKILDVLLIQHDMFRPFIVSRKVPADRLAALRTAFWQLVNGEPFLNDVKRSKRRVIAPIRGEDMEKRVAEFYKTPAALIPKAAKAIQ